MTAALAIDPAELETALPCPLCRYDLRGLPRGRCPECGHGFNPAELRAAQRKAADRPVPWLVEYPAPGFFGFVRNVLLTPLVTLRPWWFWTRLRPTMRVEHGRLRGYAGCYWLYLLVAMLLAVALEPLGYWLLGDIKRSRDIWTSGWGMSWTFEMRALSGLLPFAVISVWPWLTLCILMSFRMTLKQTGIQCGHLLRCTAYSGDLAVSFFVVILFGSALVWWSIPQSPWDRTSLTWLYQWLNLPTLVGYGIQMPSPLLLALATMLLWFGVRLAVAYTRYLAFPHAIATVVASQLILWLVLVLIWMQILVAST